MQSNSVNFRNSKMFVICCNHPSTITYNVYDDHTNTGSDVKFDLMVNEQFCHEKHTIIGSLGRTQALFSS